MTHPDFTPVPGVAYARCAFPNPAGTTAVCCLWSKVDEVAVAHTDAYMVGPCVSPAGVDQVVRTLRANPQILRLIVLGADLSGTRGLLHEALRPGKGRGALFGAEAHLDTGHGDWVVYDFPPGRVPVVQPLPPPDPGESPTGRGLPGQRITGASLWDVWPRVVREVVNHGAVSSTGYGTEQKELLAVTWVFNVKATLSSVPGWYLRASGGAHALGELNDYAARHFVGTAPKPHGVAYTYADRLRVRWDDQIARIIEVMKRKPEHRGGWASTWDNGDAEQPSDTAAKTPPCLTGLWFRRDQDGTLFTYAVFRSHDLFKAAVSNAWGLSRLAQHVADALGWPVGRLAVASLSGHVYSPDWEDARKLAKERGRGWKEDDSARSILRAGRRELDDGTPVLVVELLDADGGVKQTLRGGTAQGVERRVLTAGWVTTVSHAAWLGRELARAEGVGQ